jgi:hypothetical protein
LDPPRDSSFVALSSSPPVLGVTNPFLLTGSPPVKEPSPLFDMSFEETVNDDDGIMV